jgi:nicotinate-nucleotide adenylyltransferase
MKKRKIGLLGGTFDPFHFGHINLGLELQEKHALDEVLVCPAAASPFKTGQTTHASGQERLHIARLAVEGLKDWRVIDWEVQRGAPSYTIDTVLAIHKEAEKNKENVLVYLLLGQDILDKFSEWKEVEKLLMLASPLIGVREAEKISPGSSLALSPSLKKICQAGMTPTRILEISSTLVRDRLKRKLYCGHLVPAKILDFIYHHQLYL